jgi:MFS transporter, OPA family, glycerol-3-phosphate transporter
MSNSNNLSAADNSSNAGEKQVVWTLWFTYGAFYFCRTNISVALPGIETELGYDKLSMAIVLTALKIAYGCGQFLNGQLSERLSPRKMLAIGMFGSAALNVVFGFGTAMYFFLFVWACNGYAQSLGWTPCVRVIGNWIPIRRRGKAVGIIGTGYQITAGLSYLVAGFSFWLLGWRGVFWVPPTILVIAGVGMLFLLRETPEHHRAASGGEKAGDSSATPSKPQFGFREALRLTLGNRKLWYLAVALGMLNACRYGFVDWGVSHLVAIERAPAQREQIKQALAGDNLSGEQRTTLEELMREDLVQDDAQKKIKTATKEGYLPKAKKEDSRMTVLKSAVKYAVLPIGAILGAFLSGWATDRFFGSRRIPVICILLVLLGCLTLAYDSVARSSLGGTIALLIAVGFCIYGPQVLLVGTAPADLAEKGTSAAAAGFVNFIGYVGAALAGDLLTGYLTTNYSWNVAIYSWAGWAFGAAVVSSFLWNATGHSETEATT